jgi:hypothetical protein
VYPCSVRRIGPAFVLVLVVLAAVAGTGGYVVTRKIIGDRSVDASGGATSNATTGTSTTDNPTTGAATATPGANPTSGNPPDRNDQASSCPAITEKAVRDAGLGGELQVLRYVEGRGQGGPDAEAWICKDKNGVLIYQGHRKSGPFNAATSSDTILLALGIRGKVEERGGEFVATSPRDPTNLNDPTYTEYHVSATVFFILDLPGQRRTEYAITRTEP